VTAMKSHGADSHASWLVPVIAGLAGAIGMTACLGPSLVNPTNIDWLMHADYRLHFLGWHLYRHGPWTLPLGASPLLIWPIGSSIGLTDAIPIVGVPLKLLDAILPTNFQFIGLWLVLSFALQGVFGALLMQLATPRPLLQLLGATVLMLSPPLVFRILHAALTAHWLVLAALWLSLRHDERTAPWKVCAGWAALCAAAAATQPYIMLMIVALMLADYAARTIRAPRRLPHVVGHVAVVLGAAAIALWQSGSVMVRSEEGLEIAGFGGWSANLLTFFMPTEGRSRFAPGLWPYASGGQYEGYAYLGAGTLLLGAIVIAVRLPRLWSRPTWRAMARHLPLLAALLFLAAMAVGPIVTLGPRTLYTYDRHWWDPLAIFRTHGRMIWPLYYAVTVSVLFTASRFPYRWALPLCTLAVVLQAFDVAPMSTYVRDLSVFGFRNPLQSRFWTAALPHYRHLVLVPSNLCTFAGYVDYSAFSLLAGEYGLGINSGLTARYDTKKAATYCNTLAQEVDDGMRTEGSLYVVRPDILRELMKRPRQGQAQCTVVDGFGVCFSAASYATWRDEFDPIRSRLPNRDEFVRFYRHLDETYRTTLGRAPRDAAGTIDARVEGVVRYLAYRMEGCDHADGAARALPDVVSPAGAGFCPVTAIDHAVPPADQTLAFATQLDRTLSGRPDAGHSSTHVDLEGEAVWLQAYVRERARGIREQDARESVLAVIRGAVH